MRRISLAVVICCIAVLGVVMPSAAGSMASTGMGLAVAQRPAVTSVSPAAGPLRGGESVTIHGDRFARVTAVIIGGKKARNVRVRSSSVITAVTPAHGAGSVAIVVSTRAGASPASAVRFRYLNRPMVTGISPRSGLVTGGQVVTISGRALSYVRAVSFGPLRAAVLPHSIATQLRVRTPASWAGTVQVRVTTWGGASSVSPADRFTFQNPPARLAGSLTPAPGDVVGAGVTAASGGELAGSGASARQAPWTVTLAPSAAVPAVGQQFLLRPGGAVYPSGLAGTVTAVDSSASAPVITVSASAAPLDSAVQSAQAVFTGPLGDAAASGDVASGSPARRWIRAGGPSLTSTIDFGSIAASTLNCLDPKGRSIDVSGSLSLKLENVEAHVQVDAGSLVRKPFVDVWISYQPTLAASISAGYSVRCTLPAEWQNTHQKLFFLGDTGATIAITPDATFTVSAAGTVSFQQHSYRMLGFMSNPDGSIQRLDGKSADPAYVKVSGELKAEAYAGAQVQVGMLDVIGTGMSIGGGFAGTATSDWPPQVCLSWYPFLRGTLYAYLNAWVREWKLQGFSVELDLSGGDSCAGTGWHVTWKGNVYLNGASCPTAASCVIVGRTATYGYALRTRDGGEHWAAVTVTAHTVLSSVACVDPSRCVAGGNSGKVAVTSDGGASWSEVSLPPFADSPLSWTGPVACMPGGTCYVIANMTKYSGSVVYKSADAGRHWASVRYLTAEFSAMTCLNSSELRRGGVRPANQLLAMRARRAAGQPGDP